MIDETDALDQINSQFFNNYIPPDDDDDDAIAESVLKAIEADTAIKDKIISENKVTSSGIENFRNKERKIFDDNKSSNSSYSSQSSSSYSSSSYSSSSSGYKSSNYYRSVYGSSSEKKETLNETINKQFDKMKEYGTKIAKEELKDKNKDKARSYKSINPQLSELLNKKEKKRGVGNKLKQIIEPGSKYRKWILIGGVLVLKGLATLVATEQRREDDK